MLYPKREATKKFKYVIAGWGGLLQAHKNQQAKFLKAFTGLFQLQTLTKLVTGDSQWWDHHWEKDCEMELQSTLGQKINLFAQKNIVWG